MDITLIQPPGLVASPAFSHVAIVPPGATTIYVGGQNGVDETGSVVSSEVAEQALKAIDNASIALEAAGASLADVIAWSVMIDANADLASAYGAVAPRLARDGAPPLVTAARVAGLGVPGALIEVSAIAALMPRGA
ncbi:RidA family protein [Georgenia daeguensis]|uniref:RidA family protein n=1 Tax=Georgenia daeguensis TaxID=908355 RepID=A0ABP8EVG0_9MICO